MRASLIVLLLACLSVPAHALPPPCGGGQVFEDRNVHGPLSFAIPSAVAGYAELHARHGKLPLAVVLEPAIALAKRGLSQDWFTTLKIANSAAVLRLYGESARIYLPNSLPPVPPYQGSPGFFRQGRLAETLERLEDPPPVLGAQTGSAIDHLQGDPLASAVLHRCSLHPDRRAGRLHRHRVGHHVGDRPLDQRPVDRHERQRLRDLHAHLRRCQAQMADGR